MEVKSINYSNSQQNFGNIFIPANAKFSKHQRNIANNIRKLLRQPIDQYNGKSAEDFYKSKGIDFKITPEYKDSVVLTGYKNMKEMYLGKNKWHSYSDFIYIGNYTKRNQFEVFDIDKSFQERKYSNKLLIGAFLTFPIAIIASFLLNQSPNQTKESIKPLIEHVDSVKNKAGSIIADSSKVFKLIKK